MGRLLHFEIQASDIERAKRFYEQAFDWQFVDWSEATGGATYWGIVTGPDDQPGINGGLLQRPADAPPPEQGANAFVGTIGCEDYDEQEQKILAAGGQVAVPKSALPGMAWQGYYLDTEGNTFGLHQPDEKAGLE